jgi:hypothetical protein
MIDRLESRRCKRCRELVLFDLVSNWLRYREHVVGGVTSLLPPDHESESNSLHSKSNLA